MAYDLSRFIKAQEHSYSTALAEIRVGRKTSHWIWYIFPQLKGLGSSEMAKYYGIENLDEAKAYIANDSLRSHLLEISQALMPFVKIIFILPVLQSTSIRLKSGRSFTSVPVAPLSAHTPTYIHSGFFWMSLLQ